MVRDFFWKGCFQGFTAPQFQKGSNYGGGAGACIVLGDMAGCHFRPMSISPSVPATQAPKTQVSETSEGTFTRFSIGSKY